MYNYVNCVLKVNSNEVFPDQDNVENIFDLKSSAKILNHQGREQPMNGSSRSRGK